MRKSVWETMIRVVTRGAPSGMRLGLPAPAQVGRHGRHAYRYTVLTVAKPMTPESGKTEWRLGFRHLGSAQVWSLVIPTTGRYFEGSGCRLSMEYDFS